jgi:signal peptidase I
LRNMFQDSNTESLPEPQNLESKELLGLFEDILNADLNLRVRVTGRSMTPFLRGSEILTIKKVPITSLLIGDLIFFKTKDGFPLLHRIVRKKFNGNNYLMQTKGDALLSFDEPVTEHSILGKVCKVEKNHTSGKTKHIHMESKFRKIINYLLANKSLLKSKVYLTIHQCPLYPSLRSIIK